MALKDLKSDLSKFRKPLDTTPIVTAQSPRANKDWKTTPLAERAVPGTSQIPKTPQKTGINATTTNPTGRHTKGTDVVNAPKPSGRHTEGKEVVNAPSPQGRHEEGKEVTGTKPDGRHTEGKEVKNTVPLSGRLGDGVDVENNSVIEGRHTTGKEVDNGSAISGRHTEGKETSNNSQISGRHETDNSGFNIDGTVPPTTPTGRHTEGVDTTNTSALSGRHTTGVDNPNTSELDGRHTDGVDTVNQSPLDGRHTNGVDNPNTSPLSGRHTDGTEVTNASPLGGRHETGTSIDDNKYSNTLSVNGIHDNPHHVNHSQLDIDGNPLSNATRNQNGFVEGIGGLRTNDKWESSRFVQFAGSTTTIQNYTDLDTVGNSKLGAQLGEGTFVPGAGSIVGHPVKMIASDLGYSTDRNYSEIVGVSKLSALGFQYVQKNSPSFLDAAYSKFKVRDEAYNPYYIKQPYILRGIQKNGEAGYDPERFGLGGPDGGLIRGGAVTATVRTALDVVRIGKFMASPAGLLWNIKQVGLGLTNPNVESIGPKLTKIHTGVTSLLSVAGSAFGAHITTHGIPFANEIASYGVVQRAKKLAYGNSGLEKISGKNRLVEIKDKTDNLIGLVGLPLGISAKYPLGVMGGQGGPNSTYGLGITTHTRFYKSDIGKPLLKGKARDAAIKLLGGGKEGERRYNEAQEAINPLVGQDKYDIRNQYTPLISNSPEKTGTGGKNREELDTKGISGNHEFEEEKEKLRKSNKYPFNERPTEANPTSTPSSEIQTGIKAYSTLAYSSIPKNSSDRKGANLDGKEKFHDFRLNTEQRNSSGQGLTANWKDNNLRDNFGFGDQGTSDVFRDDYSTKVDPKDSRGDKVNLIDAKIKGGKFGDNDGLSKFSEIYQLIQGGEETKDFIPFYFTGPSQIGTGTNQDKGTEEVLVFRNTVGQVTDTFSPSWNSTQILGRADAVHTYNTWGRGISFDFKVHATSREEMKPMWRKLNYLASWTAPNYSSGVMRGGYIRFTLGNMFQETPCFISGLTISTDTDTPWEINLENDDEMLQLPHGVNVSMQLTMLMDYRPQWNGRMYSLSDRGRLDNKSTKTNWLTDSTSETAQAEDDKDVEKAK